MRSANWLASMLVTDIQPPCPEKLNRVEKIILQIQREAFDAGVEAGIHATGFKPSDVKPEHIEGRP